MRWIKEVEIAKSTDELMTSRTTTRRTDFPDDDLLDAMIECALKKLLIHCAHFRKLASVEEQRAQKYDRFSLGRPAACMTHEHVCATGENEAVQVQHTLAE